MGEGEGMGEGEAWGGGVRGRDSESRRSTVEAWRVPSYAYGFSFLLSPRSPPSNARQTRKYAWRCCAGPNYPSALPAMRVACGPPRRLPALVVGAALNGDVIPADGNYK